MEAAVFFVSAAICMAGALGVILAKNPVHSALMLVMTLFGVAVLFIAQEAYFLAAVQVIVYAGAIVVLFLFVIMLVGVDKSEDIRTEPIVGQRQLAALVGGATLVLAVLFGVVISGDVTGRPGNLPISETVVDGVEVDSNIRQLGRVLFTDYILATEITAILLTIAVVGAVLLARRPKGALQPVPEVDPPWVMRTGPIADETDRTEVVDAAETSEGDGA